MQDVHCIVYPFDLPLGFLARRRGKDVVTEFVFLPQFVCLHASERDIFIRYRWISLKLLCVDSFRGKEKRMRYVQIFRSL